MTDETPITLFQPWSVPTMKLQLPPWVLGKMIEITDKIIEDENSVSHGQYLAGQIEKELKIEHDILQEEGVYTYFLQVVGQYIQYCRNNCGKKTPVEMQMASMWTVSQFPNEYNPVHYHTQCQVSSVMYLKVPNMLKSRKKHKSQDDGSISFIHNSSRDTELSETHFSQFPIVGDMFIFGAHTLHTVYPFRCEEDDSERRSVSFNSMFRETTDVAKAEHNWKNHTEENGV